MKIERSRFWEKQFVMVSMIKTSLSSDHSVFIALGKDAIIGFRRFNFIACLGYARTTRYLRTSTIRRDKGANVLPLKKTQRRCSVNQRSRRECAVNVGAASVSGGDGTKDSPKAAVSFRERTAAVFCCRLSQALTTAELEGRIRTGWSFLCLYLEDHI